MTMMFLPYIYFLRCLILRRSRSRARIRACDTHGASTLFVPAAVMIDAVAYRPPFSPRSILTHIIRRLARRQFSHGTRRLI